VAATNSTGFVAVSAVSQTVKGSMKNISCNNYEQLKDCLPRAGFVRLKSILAPEGPSRLAVRRGGPALSLVAFQNRLSSGPAPPHGGSRTSAF